MTRYFLFSVSLWLFAEHALGQSPSYRQTLPNTSQSSLKAASQVVLDERNHVYVIDEKTQSVIHFDEVGNELEAIKNVQTSRGSFTLKKPTKLAIHNGQSLLIFDEELGHIFSLRPNGGLVIGEKGSKPGQLDELMDMALDAQGYLYVLQKKRNVIEIFNPAGHFITWIAPSKLGFQDALAIEVSAANELYVLDQKLASIFIYNVEGRIINTHRSVNKKQGVILAKALDFCVLGDGGFLLLDEGSGDVLAFDRDGLLRTTIQVAGSENEFKKAQCLSASLCNGPHMAVTFDTHVSVKIFNVTQYGPTVNPSTQRMTLIPAESDAWKVKYTDANGAGFQAVIAVDQPRSVVVLDASGKEKYALRDVFRDPVGVELDEAGNLHVVDKGEGVIKVFDTKGELIRTLGNEKQAKLKSPADLVRNSTGMIIVCDDKSGHLLHWSADGAFQNVLLDAEKSRFVEPTKMAVDSKDQIYVWDKAQNAIFRLGASGWPISLKKLQVYGDSGDESNGIIGDFFIDPMDRLHVLNSTTKQIEIYRWDLEPECCMRAGSGVKGPYDLTDVSHIAMDRNAYFIYACDDKAKVSSKWILSESPAKPTSPLRWDVDSEGAYHVFFEGDAAQKNTNYGLVNQAGNDMQVLFTSIQPNIVVRSVYSDLEKPFDFALVAINRATTSERGSSFKDYLGWALALENAGAWEKSLVAYTYAMDEMDQTERLRKYLIDKLANISQELMAKKEGNKAMAFLRLAFQYAPKDEKINALYCQGYQVMFGQTISFQHASNLLSEIEAEAAKPATHSLVGCAIDKLSLELLANGQSWDIDNAILMQKKWIQITGQPTNFHTLAQLQLSNYRNHKRENRSPAELQGMLQDAANSAERSGESADKGEALLTLMEVYLEQGKFLETEKRATAEINSMNKKWSAEQNSKWHQILAHSFEGQKKYDLALFEYDRILVLDPTLKGTSLSKAAMLKATGELDKALALFEKELTKAPNQVEIVHTIGEIYLEKEDIQNAIFQFEKAISLAPQDKSLYESAAKAYTKQGQHLKASEAWRIAFTYATNQKQKGKGGLMSSVDLERANALWLSAGLALADADVNSQQYDDAIRVLLILKADMPSHSGIHFKLGTAQLNKGMLYESANAYYTACKLDPTNAEYANAHKGVLDLIAQTAQSRETIGIVDVITQPIYPALYKNYSNKQQIPIGQLIVSNHSQLPITPTSITVFIPEFMSQPTAISNPVLMGYSDTYLQLNALIDDRILSNVKANEVNMEIELKYVKNGQPETIKKATSIVCMGRNAINWQDKLALGAFVTSGDPALMLVHRQTDLILGNVPTQNIPTSIVKAMQYFAALENWQGLNYSADPNTPYARASTNNAIIDFLQFPSEMLRTRAGDCDDFVALFAGLMESAGIHTAFIDAPGHVFAAFDLGIPPNQLEALGITPQEVILKDNKVWIPLETTMLGKTGFLDAWKSAASRYQQELQLGHFPELVEMATAHNKYIPVSALPGMDAFAFELPIGSAKRFDNELFKVTAKLKREQMAELEDRYLREPDNVFVKNRYAMLLARTGDTKKAESILKEALALTPQNAVILNNLGNVAYINANYDNALLNYESAASIDSADSEILINICNTLLALNRTAEAKSIFEKAAQIDAEVVQLYPHLKSKIQ